jgi:2-phospho-L-lactate/phosphoenolpyruvate guanylyltransferase
MPPSPERFAAIVPIRSWTAGKSRLGLDDVERASLARAFALDVIDVLTESPAIALVVVVTSDDDVRADLGDVEVIPDDGRGLNAAVAQGCAHVLESGRSHVVVVPSDLPCLTVPALAEVLKMSEGHPQAFCPDAEGDGTSLVVSREASSLVTSYGPGSAAAHRAAGLVPLLDAPPAVRRDVDTVAHLREAESLGVGRRTAAVIAQVSARLSHRP